jgi:hypothetical protein
MKHIIGTVALAIVPLFFSTILSGYHPSWAEGEVTHASSEVTNRTLRRHHILSRITGHVDMLQKASLLNPLLPDQFYHDVSLIDLNNPLLQSTEREIERLHNLTPVFQLFYRYSNYKFIEDETIDHELLKLVDYITNFFLEAPTTSEKTKESLLLSRFDKDELLQADDTEIIFRFYFQKRVEFAIHHIVQHVDPNRSVKELFSNAVFKQAKINECIERIKASKNIKSYLELCEAIEHYYYLDNFSLQHEFLLLTSLLIEVLQKSPNAVDFDFASLKKKSIRELLDSLNSLEQKSNLTLVPPTIDSNNLSDRSYDDIALKDILALEFNSSEIEFNKRVFRRYYFIERLSFIDDFPLIEKSPKELTQKIRPLISDWKNFKRYMFLSDQLLVDDFAQELFLVTDVDDKNPDHAGLSDAFFGKKELAYSLSDIEEFVGIDNVVIRFYIIKRLENSIKKMALFQDVTLVFAEEDLIGFTHPIVQDCLKQIQLSNSITPLLLLSKDLESYFYIGDEQFLREYLILMTQSETNLFETLSALTRDSKKKNLKT